MADLTVTPFCSDTSERHWFHHAHNIGNYGAWFRCGNTVLSHPRHALWCSGADVTLRVYSVWDKMLGTDASYTEWKAKRDLVRTGKTA